MIGSTSQSKEEEWKQRSTTGEWMDVGDVGMGRSQFEPEPERQENKSWAYQCGPQEDGRIYSR